MCFPRTNKKEPPESTVHASLQCLFGLTVLSNASAFVTFKLRGRVLSIVFHIFLAPEGLKAIFAMLCLYKNRGEMNKRTQNMHPRSLFTYSWNLACICFSTPVEGAELSDTARVPCASRASQETNIQAAKRVPEKPGESHLSSEIRTEIPGKFWRPNAPQITDCFLVILKVEPLPQRSSCLF